MAYRFGRSHWQDDDRLNLMKVCLEYQQWDERLKAMRAIYAKRNYPPGYFTENTCREELERIMSLPTPNLRLDVSKTFVYSRKIMMEKWIDYFDAEVRKVRSSQAEMGLVNVRRNVELLKEVLSENITDERIAEIMAMLGDSDIHKTDAIYKRIVGSLDTAILDKFEEEGVDIEDLEVPPTKPPSDNVDPGTKGYLTPAHQSQSFDMSFFSPQPAFEMQTLAAALRDAVPVAEPEPEYPQSPPRVEYTLPDEIMEPQPLSPVAKPKTEEIDEEMEVEEQQDDDELFEDAPDSPNPVRQPTAPEKNAPSTSQKKKEPSLISVDDIKKETSYASPSPAPEHRQPPPPPTRARGRPRLHSNSASTSSPSTSRKVERSSTPRDQTPEVPAKRRHQERSQEPSSSSSLRKPRNSSIPTSSGQRRKEDTPSSRMSSVTSFSRSESGLDFQGVLDYLNDTREMTAQTDITVRTALLSEADIRRYSIPPYAHSNKAARGRKSQRPGEVARSVSRNSSSSTPQPRDDSVTRNTVRTVASQTNIRMDIEKDDVMFVAMDSSPRVYIRSTVDLEKEKHIKVDFDTCKEIELENAAGDRNGDMGKRSTKVDGRKEMPLIVETGTDLGKRLIRDMSFQLASARCDVVSSGQKESPIKRRRDAAPREDPERMKMSTMFRSLWDCEWSEPFRKPVPLGEESYEQGVHERIDLSMIRREMEGDELPNETKFLLRAYRMISNAVMYNGFDHDVHVFAKNIFNKVMSNIALEEKDLECVVKDEPPSSNASSLERDSVRTLNSGGVKRVIMRKNQNIEGIMTPQGNRKAKKKL
uniref:Bromo domain-containing protein n=1 Tax=Caenorhabditis tropicalis TaxID=1561998 RepID=A0A1I7TSL2_9PELO